MNFLDFSEQSLGIRTLAAVTVLIILAVIAAGVVVFAMMMVLFSVDGPDHRMNDSTLKWGIWIVGISLGLAVLVPPILVLLRASPAISLLPAGLGFVAAGLTTLWLVVQNLGT
ncbi:hypothetical protein [Crateriforma spongiae]|uniref:hypothetical protein n=1 Tax=Crateriforma spongiae TaxID=2724528 RepID=UPI001448393B|nr:hypothetical protein [Crateriforma spongiae]